MDVHNRRRNLARALTAAALGLLAVGPIALDGAPSAEAQEPEQAEATQAEPELAEPEQAEPEQAEATQAAPEQAKPKQAKPKRAKPKQGEPKQAEAKATKGAKAGKGGEPRKPKRAPKGRFEHGCRVQPPQKFLQRRSFVQKRLMDGAAHAKAVRWLAERYGHAGDDVTRRHAAQSAAAQAKVVRFMGQAVQVHGKIAPALACVEKRIKASCGGRSSRYTLKAVGGLRTANTFRGGEISNHLFGIAIDIDPDRNPCCGCVDPWPDNPICKQKGGSVYQRTSLPKCWVQAFERFGFDWLGHDELEDTMHFEFLGDPDLIKR